MNKLTRYFVALSLTLMAANAHAIPLADLYAGASIVVGDKLFDNWEELKNESCSIAGCISGGVDTASIDVIGVGDGTVGNAYGLQFIGSNASWSATGDEFIDLWFRFSVEALDPTRRITGAVMTGTTTTQGEAHLVVVEKDIFNFNTSDHLAFMEIFSDPLDSPSLQVSDMADLGSQTKIWVEDNVFIDGFGGSAQLIGFTQRFEQTVLAAPTIDIEKLTNGLDADDPNAGDAPSIAPGEPVSWTYLVTNTGNVELTNVTVDDDQGVAVSCPQTTLAVREAMICTANGTAEDLYTTGFTTVPGVCGIEPGVPLYENMGTATGDYLDQRVEDTDPSHYCNPRINQAPVAVDNNYSPDEDTQLVGNVITDNTGEGVDSDDDGDGLTIFSNTDVAHGVLVLNPDGSFTYDPTPDYCGPDSFTYVITDDPPAIAPVMTSDAATVSISVICLNDPPEVTEVSPGTLIADYSDFVGTVTITATDIDDTSLTLTQAGAPSDIPNPGLNTTTNCVTVPNDSIEDGSTCTWTMDGQVLVPGDVGHSITFTADDGEALSVCSGVVGECRHTLNVEADDATVALDTGNPVALEVATDGGNSGMFSMFFTAWEMNNVAPPVPDDADFAHDGGSAAHGDLNNAEAFMSLVPVGPGGPITVSCTITEVDPAAAGYDQVLTAKCDFDDVPANVYEVVAEVDGVSDTTRYYAGTDEDVFTVYDPSLGFTTGGGRFYWPGTCSKDNPEDENCNGDYPGDRTNIGFNMKYNKKRTNLQGKLLLMRHTITGETYKVKSNALNDLSIGDGTDGVGDYGWAAFSGKATFREPGFDTEGNHPFVVYVEDHGEQGCNQNPSDEFWIEVKDGGGNVVLVVNGPNSDPAGPDAAIDGDDEPIECGNIIVPHKAGGKGKGKKNP